MKKQKIAVLFGGYSSEYEVSLKSAYGVITNIDSKKYEPILLGITRSGEWFYYSGKPEKINNDTWHNPDDCTKAIISPDRETHGVLVFDKIQIRTIRLDAAIPILHGKNGEDGTVQGLLEMAGIPIVGCKTLCSALCMDKNKAHKIAELAGIRTPRSFTLKSNADGQTMITKAKDIGYPLFVKPVKAGSSFGISKVVDETEIQAAFESAARHDDEIIIEENIPGFEVGCAVLGNDELVVGELDEIQIVDGFFDFKEKYTLETAMIHVPARITKHKSDEIKHTAKKLYRAFGCTGFARVDLFLTPSGSIIFNEINTIPGFTEQSRYPNMLKSIGMTLEQVVSTAIEMAVGRNI